MRLSSVRYILPEALRAMRRNIVMTVVAIATVAITLSLFSLFYLLGLNINNNAQQFLSDLEIMVYFENGLNAVQQVQAEQALNSLPSVASVRFITKDETYQWIEDRFPNAGYALEGTNPLPDTFSIMAETPEGVVALARAAEGVTGVTGVRYGEGMAEELLSFTKTIREVGMAVMILLGVSAVVLVAMSTRISVYARQKDIMVMKWIGSTNSFIRWPFLLEGVVVGFFGSAAALLISGVLYDKAVEYLAPFASFMFFIQTTTAVVAVAPFILLAGVLMGGLGSAFSVARFLDV